MPYSYRPISATMKRSLSTASTDRAKTSAISTCGDPPDEAITGPRDRWADRAMETGSAGGAGCAAVPARKPVRPRTHAPGIRHLRPQVAADATPEPDAAEPPG